VSIVQVARGSASAQGGIPLADIVQMGEVGRHLLNGFPLAITVSFRAQADLYRWVILALSTLSIAVLVAAPSMALAVLFNEIQRDLRRALVEVGLIWSSGRPSTSSSA